MDITVILCTFNRCQYLEQALESLARSILPDSVDWEVLVVDNNSNDRTPEVFQRLCRRYPGRFRYLFEGHPGKSAALNAGIREARGGVLAFTDDDVKVEPTWLQNLTAALADGECVGVGGRILPEKTFSPPQWIPVMDRYALGPLAVFTPDLEAGPLTESPVGANMAFEKRAFEKYGGFRLDLGPNPAGSSPQKSEDSEFGQRLLTAGERLRYVPSAVVYHSVPPHRVKKKYFLAWWLDKARSDVRAFGVPPGRSSFAVAGVPLFVFRRLATWSVRWMVEVRPVHRFSRKLNVWTNLGQLIECYRLSGESKSKGPKAVPNRHENISKIAR
jgi:glucosyl-dolichyl phosphate glucuronosyltransferase